MEQFIDEGNIEAAIAEFKGLARQHPTDFDLKRRAYAYMAANNAMSHLSAYAPYYAAQLIEAGKPYDAIQIYLDAIEREQPFKPVLPEHYLPLMRELRYQRRFRDAVNLAKGFHKQFPANPHTPEIYLNMAKICCEDLHKDDPAIETLRFLNQHFPGHELSEQINGYLKALLTMKK